MKGRAVNGYGVSVTLDADDVALVDGFSRFLAVAMVNECNGIAVGGPMTFDSLSESVAHSTDRQERQRQEVLRFIGGVVAGAKRYVRMAVNEGKVDPIQLGQVLSGTQVGFMELQSAALFGAQSSAEAAPLRSQTYSGTAPGFDAADVIGAVGTGADYVRRFLTAGPEAASAAGVV